MTCGRLADSEEGRVALRPGPQSLLRSHYQLPSATGQWIQRPIDHEPQTAASVAVAGRTGRSDSQITLPLVMLAKATPLALATRVVNRYGALHGFVKSPTFL